MGILEKESRKRNRRNALRRLILETSKMVGIVSIALIALPVVGAMAKMGMIPSKRQEEVIKHSCDRMIRSGFLIQTKTGIQITEKGEKTLRHLELRDYHLRKPKRWDKKWRVIIFDIPHDQRRLRDRIREILKMIGFVRLQNSVWIYPYDCEDVMTLLKTDLRVGKNVLYMIVEALENDWSLKRQFKLS